MEVDTPPNPKQKILDYLTENTDVVFKSQQRGEKDLTKSEKTDIASDIYDKNKLTFLLRFGKYLQQVHLEHFQQYANNGDESSYEISVVLKECLDHRKKCGIKNRRYEALKEMVENDSEDYFSEMEMMKRDPLLYEQLVGQFLTQDEKMERDRIDSMGAMGETSTLVGVLLKGIERDDAKLKREEQEQNEESDDDNDGEEAKKIKPISRQWGEFSEGVEKRTIKRKTKCKHRKITQQERELLREEFVSSMYQSFLDGKDEDFDYGTVDENERYDNHEMQEWDEEEKYFDSEEPQVAAGGGDDRINRVDDELERFMSEMNHQNPAVNRLSQDLQNL